MLIQFWSLLSVEVSFIAREMFAYMYKVRGSMFAISHIQIWNKLLSERTLYKASHTNTVVYIV